MVHSDRKIIISPHCSKPSWKGFINQIEFIYLEVDIVKGDER
jgi:hypothetical protein